MLLAPSYDRIDPKLIPAPASQLRQVSKTIPLVSLCGDDYWDIKKNIHITVAVVMCSKKRNTPPHAVCGSVSSRNVVLLLLEALEEREGLCISSVGFADAYEDCRVLQPPLVEGWGCIVHYLKALSLG